MLEKLSRWAREGPLATRLPWRWRAPLERATVEHAYPSVTGPLRWTLAPGPPEAVLLFGGDLALHRWRPESDPSTLFGGLASLTGTVQGSILNLESQLTARETPAGIIGSSLRADPSAIRALSYLGLSAVSCANNHALDFGAEGLSESVAGVESAGIGVIGVTGPGRDGGIVRDIQGIRFGFLAFTDDWRVSEGSPPPLAPVPHDPVLVRRRISAMQQVSDLVVVQLHWGYEWSMYPMRTQRDLARQYADAGARLVLCHHAHVPMGVERRGSSLIAHGLGNFHFGPSTEPVHPFSHSSFLLRVAVARSGVMEAEVVPIHTDVNGRVDIATGRTRDQINRSLAYLSARLDDDRYLDRVERSLLAEQGCVVFLDLARRLAEGDTRGIAERVLFLRPPRQRVLTAELAAQGGLMRQVGLLLDRVRECPGSLQESPLATEIASTRSAVQQFRSKHRGLGRIP